MNDKCVFLTAFNLRPEWQETPLSLTGLAFPLDWYGPLCRLQGELENRTNLPNTPQVRSLNSVLSALVPHLMSLPRHLPAPPEPGGDPPAPNPWLLAQTPVDVTKIWFVIQAWMAQIYSGCDSYASVQKAVQAKDLQWKSLEARFDSLTEENGTAKVPGIAYTALPALLADLLVERNTQIPVGKETRGLMRAPSDNGASLMSWPPAFVADRKGQRWGFSYVIDISLQTLIGCPRPRIHFHFGVRRWVSRSDKKLWFDNTARSVYLHTSDRWLGLEAVPTFTVARLKSERSDSDWIPVWDDKITEIANRLQVPFPSAIELGQDPSRWLEGGSVFAGVVEKNATFHEVQPGVDLKDHLLLTQVIAKALEPELIPCAPLAKPKSFPNTAKHPLTQHIRDLSPNVRLAGLRESVGKSVSIEVHWQNSATRDMLADRLLALLQRERPELEITPSDKPSGKQTRSRVPEPPPSPAPECMVLDLGEEGKLTITTRELGTLGALFPLPPTKPGNPREFAQQQADERAKAVVQTLGMASEPTLAIVELPDYSGKSELRRRDPKQALRQGMARAGRVSKFTTGAPEELLQRCEGAVRDGLRHLGYLPASIGFTSKRAPLPEDMVVVAPWLVRLNQRRGRQRVFLPVAVVMHTRFPEVRAWLPDGGGIRSYHQALLDIAKLNPQDVTRKNKNELLRQVQQLIEHDLPAETQAPLLVLASAQNMRELWKGLNNGQIAWGGIRFGYNAPPLTFERARSEVRFIRLRTNENKETPEWYTDRSTPGSSPGSGYASGLWQDPEVPHLFYSIAPKSRMMAGKSASKQEDPGEYYAIPAPLEIVPIMLRPGDNDAVWARAVHQWRGMGSLLTSETLRFPLPLALASRMDDYAKVIGNWDWVSQEEDENSQRSD